MHADKYQHITDTELLEHYNLDNDNEWMGILLQRYTLLLFGVCMKYLKNEEEAKDAVQQIFLKAITELKKYKVSYFKSWIYMVAKNHCLMKLRDRTARLTGDITEEIADDLSGDDPDGRNHFIEKDRTLELMGKALEELSAEQKRCVTLFYLEKKSYQAISEMTGFPVLKVKSYIQNGKRNLRLSLDRKLNLK